MHLAAPYCTIPRDYLSDTPLLGAMGFLVSQHGQLGAIPPLPFLSISPLESMRSGDATTPHHKRGISAILVRYHMKTRQNGCDTPLCDLISKRHCAIGGGRVSCTGPLRLYNIQNWMVFAQVIETNAVEFGVAVRKALTVALVLHNVRSVLLVPLHVQEGDAWANRRKKQGGKSVQSRCIVEGEDQIH